MDDKKYKEIYDAVAAAITEANRYPFLFIGSGLSKRYLGTPSWEPLLREMCDRTIGAQEFLRLSTRAKTAEKRGDTPSALPYLAELMEDEVNDYIVTDDSFEGFRKRHADALAEGKSPMRTLVVDMLSDMTPIDGGNAEMAALATAGKDRVSGVITTNYDMLCEQLFPDFDPYIGQDDLIFRDPSYAREIYEIHGSINDADSLVITESDYREFDRKAKYLAAKMLTVFMEYPIIFLGYSISDRNVRRILGEVCQCVGAERLDDLRGRIVFVQHGSSGGSPVSTHTESFDGQPLSMVRITTEDFTPVYEAISGSAKLYSTRFIREIRSDIYDLASHIDPSREVVLAGVDNALDRLPENKKVVLGIGLVEGEFGLPITANDLYEDVVLDNKHLDPTLVTDAYLEILLRRNSGGLPIYKYLSAYSGEPGPNTSNAISRQSSVDSFRNRTIRKSLDGQRDRFAGHLSVCEMVEHIGRNTAYKHMAILEDAEIDCAELGEYLRWLVAEGPGGVREGKTILSDTEFRRMVRIYDLLRYGPIFRQK